MKLFLTLALLFPLYSFATTCPHLAGDYLCPGNNGKPDFKLKITEELSEDRTSAEYLYSYPDLGIPDIKAIASSKGVLNTEQNSLWITCFRDVMFFFYLDNPKGFLQTTSLTYRKDLEVFVRGKRATLCKRQHR